MIRGYKRSSRRMLTAVACVVVSTIPAVSAQGQTGPSGASGVSGPSGGTGATGPIPACDAPGPIEASDLPEVVTPEQCDLTGRVITDFGVGVPVAPPGEGYEAYEIFPDGSGEELKVETLADGTVVLSDVGSEAVSTSRPIRTSGTGPLTPIDRCDDDQHVLSGFIERDRHDWYIKTSSIPTGLPQADVITRIRNGIRNITQGFNDCNLPDDISATSNYLGSTNTSANHNGSTCTTHDAKNVVDFGPLNSGGLAFTCNHTVGSDISNSDVRLRSSVDWKTASPGPSCSGQKYDLESVMTHERGHTFGLDHVGTQSSDTHSELTMYPSVKPCNDSHRTLGLGDMIGLVLIY
jgi:hypothetical protein